VLYKSNDPDSLVTTRKKVVGTLPNEEQNFVDRKFGRHFLLLGIVSTVNARASSNEYMFAKTTRLVSLTLFFCIFFFFSTKFEHTRNLLV